MCPDISSRTPLFVANRAVFHGDLAYQESLLNGRGQENDPSRKRENAYDCRNSLGKPVLPVYSLRQINLMSDMSSVRRKRKVGSFPILFYASRDSWRRG